MATLDRLTAISPLDGRYGSKVEALREVFSEYGLVKRRVAVECAWLAALCAHPGIPECPPLAADEAAAIDGAGEWTVFAKITLPMTTPILAVNALNHFVAAYNSWEWAFLVCQKESQWTIAVWMYQMSQEMAGQPWCVMAGFVLVSIPTALVFLLCQKVILRGIVLPSMK